MTTCEVCGDTAIGTIRTSRGDVDHCGLQHRAAKWGRVLGVQRGAANAIQAQIARQTRNLAAAAGLY